MTPSASEEKLWTPANIVTLLRICFIPLFVVAMLSPWPTWLSPWIEVDSWKEWIAAAIFIVLAATDALDGYLARSRGEITNFGKFMDPLADKILVAAALLALIELGVLPSWVALIILCREFIVSGIRMVAATQGLVIAASWYGKAKTVTQIIALVLFIIKDNHMVSDFSAVLSDHLYLISWAVMIIALILTIVSMLDYLVKAKGILGFSGAKDTEQVAAFGEGKSENKQASLEDASIEALAREVLELARKKNYTLATAESCTGGMISAVLTSIPGSSQVIEGGIVSYSNAVKHTELAVRNETLDTFGAVSEETAREMAEGARSSLRVDVAVSVTGIAGPDGGSVETPVGTVWIGVAREAETYAQKFIFQGDRDQVRQESVKAALQFLKNHAFL